MTAERARRWRLVLGDQDGDGTRLQDADLRMDAALDAVYGERAQDRQGGLAASTPRVARWLGDIREAFPTSVVRVLQRDALERLQLTRMLLEPELLAAVVPDARLAADLVALAAAMPERTREAARDVVRQVVDELQRRLADQLRTAVGGALDRSARTRRPRTSEIDWDRTIRANLRGWDPHHRRLVAERLIGHGRRRRAAELRDVILLVDQSASMATSVVHAAVVASVLASIRSLRTSLVAFATEVADLTELLEDPVDVLFGAQLSGGTDIDRAVGYALGLVRRPEDTVLVLITDLFEGGDADRLRRRIAGLVRAGVLVVVLLALDDDGAPAHDGRLAADLAALGVPCLACTPDVFPDLMAAALRRDDVALRAAELGLVVAG